MDQSSISQNRRSRRSNVLLAASIEASGTVLPVKLRNLSTEGAMVEGDRLPVEGSQVLFRRNELSVESRVAWVHGSHAGVAFNQRIAPEEVLRHVPKPKHRETLNFKRPGLSSRNLSPEEWRLIETWACTPSRDPLGE